MLELSIPFLKARPNDRNMPTQHITTLLGATCCVRLATLLRHVVTCWVLLAQIWPFSNLSQQHPTCRNTSQQGGQTQASCDMLRWHVAIVWPGLYWNIFVTNVSKQKYLGFFHVQLTVVFVQKLFQRVRKKLKNFSRNPNRFRSVFTASSFSLSKSIGYQPYHLMTAF